MPDVNVWLALAAEKHIHHPLAVRWFNSTAAGQAAFCRITQMGLLRLLTNRHVMQEDVLTQVSAWRVYHRLMRDGRLQFLAEADGVEQSWERCTQQARPAVNLWTDAYLHAFATQSGLQLVSFDRGLRNLPGEAPLILAPD